MSNPVVIDFETFYSKKLKYSLTTQIAETYCRHHLFDPYMLSVYDGSQSWVGNPRDFNWNALDGKDLLAHNMYFEQNILIELERRGWIPKITPSKLTCTANMTAFLCNRRPLAGAVEHLYGVKLSKDDRSDAADKRWPDDFTAEQRKSMQEYALRDAYWPWKIWTDHNHKWSETEQALSRITINQGIRGVRINRRLLEDYICQSHEMLKNTEKLIPWIEGAEDEDWEEFNTKPTSTKCIAEQCRRSGIPCSPVKSEDEEAYELWERTYGPAHPWIKALSSWRSINKLYKTFLVMKDRLRADDTMPFALLYFGAHTGRWSATAKVNLQNQRKIPVLCNEQGFMETDDSRIEAAAVHHEISGQWPDWVKYAIDFRALIIPREGKKMIVSDLSQIEPRVLAWLTGNTKLLKMISGGMAIYEAHARDSMGWTGGSLKKEDKNKYALAKARVLALGYGAAWEKFILMAKVLSGLDITKDDPEFIMKQNRLTGQMEQVSGYGEVSRQIVAGFRAENPAIVGMWKYLDESMKRSVGEDFVMRLPSGRAMTYERVRGERRIVEDPETGLPKSRSVYTVGVGHKRVITYGGKLTENITQAVARDVFGEHVVAMDKRGWDNLFSAHDEAVLETGLDVTAKDVEEEMSRCPDWLSGCPISAEAKEVLCYQK